MREVKVVMPLVKNLSVNHYLIKSRRGVFKRKEIQDWQDSLGWQIKTSHVEDWKLPLSVRCDLIQSDNRTRDVSNYCKVILDSIEEATGVNDSNFRWQDGDVLINPELDSHLIITISEMEG